MQPDSLNRVSGLTLNALAFFALALVCIGFTRPPLADEGALAHLFQLSGVGAAVMMVVVLATAEWAHPSTLVWRLGVPVVALIVAFAMLYYMEHVYYPAHYPPPIR